MVMVLVVERISVMRHGAVGWPRAASGTVPRELGEVGEQLIKLIGEPDF